MVHAEVGNTESTPVSVFVCVSVSFVCECVLCVILFVHLSVCNDLIVFFTYCILGLKMCNKHVLVMNSLFLGWNIFKLVPSQPLDPDVTWNFGRLKNKKHVEKLKIWTSNFGKMIDWWLGTEIRDQKLVGWTELITPVLSLDSYGSCQLSSGLR